MWELLVLDFFKDLHLQVSQSFQWDWGLNLWKYSYLFKQTNICSSHPSANRTLFHEFASPSYAAFKKEPVNIFVSLKKFSLSLFFI